MQPRVQGQPIGGVVVLQKHRATEPWRGRGVEAKPRESRAESLPPEPDRVLADLELGNEMRRDTERCEHICGGIRTAVVAPKPDRPHEAHRPAR